MISITNLAERHLRLGVGLGGRHWRRFGPYINHESSRKAFETGHRVHRLDYRDGKISITNLAERHLRLDLVEDVDSCHR